ncbi:MAG: hypothetical protein Q4D60_06865 [Eubacteriales bacterium]|nr:hypothetical protein [Eubacteriales bacterium]
MFRKNKNNDLSNEKEWENGSQDMTRDMDIETAETEPDGESYDAQTEEEEGGRRERRREKKKRFSFFRKKEEESLYGEEAYEEESDVSWEGDQEEGYEGEYDAGEEYEEYEEYEEEDGEEEEYEESDGEEEYEEEIEEGFQEKKGLFRFFRKKDEVLEEESLPGSEEETFSGEGYYELEEEKKKFSKKKILCIVGAAFLVVGVVIYFMVSNISGGDEGEAYVESVMEIMGYRSGSGANNRYTGEVEAQDSWNVSLQSGLSVEKCFVSVGDEVKEGDKLFSYNTEELKLAKDKKELEVETLQNENTQLNKDIASYQSDLKSANASEKIELQTQILTAQTTIKKNEFAINSGKEDIKKLEGNIKDATVTSKMNGVVKSINTALGEGSDGDDMDSDMMGSDTGDDSVYMSILAIGDYRVKGKVSETNVWDLNEGDSVIIRSRVDDTATWKGVIEKIKTEETADSDENEDSYLDDEMTGESASSYYFYVSLDSDDGLMMGQHVLIEQNKGQDDTREGVWLPSAYVREEGEKYYVWVSNRRDRLDLKEVTIGEYNEDLDQYEIVSGVDLEDYIACDADNLSENMKTTKKQVNEGDDEDEYLDEEENDDEIYDDEDDYDEDFSDEALYEEDWDEEDEGEYELIDEGFDESEFEDEDDGLDEDEVVDFTDRD